VRWARWGLLLLGFLLAACGTARSGVAGCPYWADALRRAQEIAACDASHRGDPKSRCQAAIRRCKGGCDICQFLKPGGLGAYVADKDEENWGPIERVPMSDTNPNGYKGLRAWQDPGLLSREYKFNWYLCNMAGWSGVLGETIVHEAMHECIAVSPPGILDDRLFPPSGCSAEDLENICVGK
jgi:hypothetical protein